MKRLNADIRDKNFRRVYLLYGEEAYLKESYKNKLKEAILPGEDMNYMYVSGKDTELSKLRDFTDTMPFFADRRLLLLENTELFKKSAENFPEWIDGLPETTVVIFIENSVDKRNRLYKKVSEKGYVCEMNHPDEKALENWLLSIVGKNSLSITKAAFELFRDLTGNDMVSLKNEIEKLCDFCGEKGQIEAEDVRLITTPVLENRIFALVEQVTLGNHERSMALYYDLIALREAPLRILYLITRQLSQMYSIKEMKMQRLSNNDIAAAVSLKPGIIFKLTDQASSYTLKELENAIAFSAELEESVKTGDLSETMAVELLIHRLTLRKSLLKDEFGSIL